MGYPDLERFAYTFGRGEISMNRKVHTAISSVQFDQPTTSGEVRGTRPWPLAITEGTMEKGEGTLTFSDEAERIRFIDGLGNGWRSKRWRLNWILTAKGRPNVKFACFGCRVLSNPVEHEEGEEALGGDIQFEFMYHTINGKVPHEGLPTTA